jgi:DNA-binding Xre family transcriptional regulator
MKFRLNRIEELFLEQKTNKAQVAKKLGITRQSFGITLNGHPSTRTVEKIADVLNTNPIDLLELEEGFEHVYNDGIWCGIEKKSISD